MHISELYVYPVKGAAGVPLVEARLDEFGIEHDRRWLVVDAAGGFVTQRSVARLALLHTELQPGWLVLRSQLAGELRLPLRADRGKPQQARIWDDVVDAVAVGSPADAFISTHLGFEARLLYMPETTLRQVDPAHARPGDRVSFADGFPLLLVSHAAVDALNGRLPQPLTVSRFRPNVVIAGAGPHEEDGWRRVRLGDVECEVVKPCARCAVTTIDPATAEAGPEPLRTLAGYRRWEGKVFFGQNAIHRARGVLHAGDAVEVLEWGAPRPPLPATAAV